MAIGGSIESVTIRGRSFAVAADADATRDLGGFSNERQMNGNGTRRLIKTRKGWEVSGLSLEINDTRGDHEFLQDVADGDDVPVTVTYASGITYEGLGNITGDLQVSSQSTTGSVTLGGGGTFTQQ